MFIGEPAREMRSFYKHVTAMQDLAFSIIRPGIPCSLVDKEVTRYYEENGLMEYWRHHTGHALGLGKHEAPFFDSFDDTLIEPGMVFSVEPGLYVKNLGGFRLSDTVLVTGDGIERITYYPREIERNIIP
jgi:Xaa-Pro aminopeptidase